MSAVVEFVLSLPTIYTQLVSSRHRPCVTPKLLLAQADLAKKILNTGDKAADGKKRKKKDSSKKKKKKSKKQKEDSSDDDSSSSSEVATDPRLLAVQLGLKPKEMKLKKDMTRYEDLTPDARRNRSSFKLQTLFALVLR